MPHRVPPSWIPRVTVTSPAKFVEERIAEIEGFRGMRHLGVVKRPLPRGDRQ